MVKFPDLMKSLGYLLLFGLILNLTSCQPEKSSSDDIGEIPNLRPRIARTMSGQELADLYCGSCHLKPDPSLLSRNIWKNQVLPEMAHRLGIKDPLYNPPENYTTEEIARIQAANVFPEKPLIDSASWNKIVQYYTQSAPDRLGSQNQKNPSITETSLFEPEPIYAEDNSTPFTTSLYFNHQKQKLMIGTSSNYTLHYQYPDGPFTKHISSSPLVDVFQDDEQGMYLLFIGNMFPNDQKNGQLIYQDKDGEEKTCIDSLPRPVHANFTDLNQDGLLDIVICGFGNFTGKLSWWENKGPCQYEEHVLLEQPGALKTVTIDFNEDGLPDLLSLFGQGKEGIYIHLNQGNGDFKTQILLPFMPVNGSAYFELADFERDGDLDILYVNGDNADRSFELKPYHGIHIFTNDGTNHFEESFFYPMYGAFSARAEDFDQDGDLDIAAISFFPDYQSDQPESFVYLENQRAQDQAFPTFLPQTITDPNQGHWLVMETDDLDGDGRIDIILGSFSFSPAEVPAQYSNRWKREALHALILWNKKP